MKVHAKVMQISERGAFINVLDNVGGGIGVEGHSYTKPTYLFLRGSHNWMLVVFDGKDWRDEEMPKLIESWQPARVLELPALTDYEVKDAD